MQESEKEQGSSVKFVTVELSRKQVDMGRPFHSEKMEKITCAFLPLEECFSIRPVVIKVKK